MSYDTAGNLTAWNGAIYEYDAFNQDASDEVRLGRLYPQTWNRYTYAVNNPLCLVDPDGLRPLDPTLLQFFHALFGSGADFTNIDIRGGFDGHQATWIAGASAVTIGDTIFVGADQDGEIRKRSPNAVALLAHELTHAYQASGSGRPPS